ncbi:MAG: hypothetical protein PQJ58_21845 [Spirochaetales bacterium]|nr:hypothetical protein [Spirochaetales bacterium]
MKNSISLLYSQIGYDTGDPKKIFMRSSTALSDLESAYFEVTHYGNYNVPFKGTLHYWGECWGSYWWVLDISEFNGTGEFFIRIYKEGHLLHQSSCFRIGDNLLWDETVEDVALTQMEARAGLARNSVGWKDCGSDWREANSHASAVIGFCDLLDLGYENLSLEFKERLMKQLITGCEYLAACQDKSESLGHPSGSLIHEIPNHMVVIPGDNLLASIAWTRTSRLFADVDPQKSSSFLKRAVRAYEYMKNEGKPYGASGFSRLNHGAPDDYIVPDEWMTRDLLQFLWASLELCTSGLKEYEEDVFHWASEVLSRQIGKDEAEGGFYGHFRTFSHGDFSEKANIHHHVGHDTGGIFPYYIYPFFDMINRWWDRPEAADWKQMIQNFAEGFFLPACTQNPFHLIPTGYFKNAGLMNFCGPWHGINASICFGAVLSLKLESFTGNKRFRDIAVGNIQWIAGTNAGISKDIIKGFHIWDIDLPEGISLPFSMIDGIGNRSVQSWSKIKGSIVNGFSSNPQFELLKPASTENDGPFYFTDEDWIPHGAAWISALAHLRQTKFFSS